MVAGARSALALLDQLALGYRHLCQYKCGEAIAVFQGLPERQKQTGWGSPRNQSTPPPTTLGMSEGGCGAHVPRIPPDGL